MKGNTAKGETVPQHLIEVTQRVRALLPTGWSVMPWVDRSAQPGKDWLLDIVAEDGAKATMIVHYTVGRPSSLSLVDSLRRLAAPELDPLLVVPYIGPIWRRACEEHGLSYIDATGWAWIRLSKPGLFVRQQGAQRDPVPARTATMTRLTGAGAGRVIRTLLAASEQIGVRALAGRAGVAPGTVSKVLKALASDGVVDRSDTGRLLAVSKRAVVARWTQDYQFLRANTIGWFLAPRGVSRAIDRATATELRIIATGSLALRAHLPERRAPVTPVTALSQLALYVPTLTAAEGLGLVPTDRATANVILAEPYDPLLLLKANVAAEELPVTDVGQTVADLLTLPGRGPEEADQLMDLLAESDPMWR